jgi:broad specificity phosphatase PhoE
MAAQKIMLIRHGEKQIVPPPLSVNVDGIHDKHSLSIRGWQRAGALVPFFRKPWATGIATPTVLFGSRVTAGDGVHVEGEDVTKSLRPQQTLTPLAEALGVTLNTDWSVGEEPQLVAAIKNATGIVLVAWEHKHIPLIARALSSDAPDHWPHGDRFDLVWVLDTIVGSGLYSFREIHQNLLAGDTP